MVEKTIECEPTGFEMDMAFAQKKIKSPIIHFIEYDEKSKEYVYRDDITNKKVRISAKHKVIPCPICENRRDTYRALKREVERMKPKSEGDYVQEWERNKDEYIQKLRECPKCRARLSSGTADVNMFTHIHSCAKCNLNFPEEPGQVYEGDFFNDNFKRDQE